MSEATSKYQRNRQHTEMTESNVSVIYVIHGIGTAIGKNFSFGGSSGF